MKTDVKVTDVIAVGVQDSAYFHLEEEDVPHIFGILRGSLYANKPLAVLREYSCNGQDAHTEVGTPEKPIQVKMPNHFEPVLKIRDFGPGMSHADVMKVYNAYGKSTKRGSNEQIGMLGIGSKSAFCYGESFSITSFYNGVASLYEAYIDATEKGIVALINTEPTNEPNGIEIAVKVRTQDINLFNDAAKQFYKTFNPKPTILGNDSLSQYLSNIKDEILLEGNKKDWYIRSNKNSNVSYGYQDAKIYVRMGNIVYPFDMNYLDAYADAEKWVRPMSYCELFINVGIGDVKFAASREALEYHEKTIKFVKNKVQQIYNELRSEVEREIAASPNLWTARKNLKLRKDNLGHIQWKPSYKGVVLEDFNVPGDVIKNLGVEVLKQNYRGHFIEGHQIASYNDPILFLYRGDFNITQMTARAKQHLATLTNTGGKEFYIIKGTDVAINKLQDHKEFKGADFVELNTIKLVVKNNIAAKIRKKNNFGKVMVFKYKGGTAFPYSDNWEPAEVKTTDDIVYVELNKYIPTYTKYNNKLHFIKDAVNYYKQITGKELVVYGVRSALNVPKNWVSLRNWIDTQSSTFWSEADLKKAINYNNITNQMPEHLKCLKDMPTICGNGKLKELVDMYKDCVNGVVVNDTRLRLVRKFADAGTILEPSPINIIGLIDEVNQKYKFLALFKANNWHERKERSAENYKNEFKALVELVESGKL